MIPGLLCLLLPLFSLQISLIGSMAFVPAYAHILHIGSALEIILSDLNDIDMFKIELVDAFLDLGIKDGIDSHSLVFR